MNDLLAQSGGYAATQQNLLFDQGAIVGVAKNGPARFWTNREEAVLREHYVTSGVAACMALLPGRAAKSIYQKAAKMGLPRPTPTGRVRAKRQRYKTTPALDEAIAEVYRRDDTLQGLKNLCRLTGRPRAWLQNRAAVLGFSKPQFREAPWSEAELAILEARMHLAPTTIRLDLKTAGYRRTVNAIVLMLRRRKGWARGKADGEYTKLMLQDCFGVTGGVLTRWAKECGLKVLREPKLATGRAHQAAEWSVRERHLRLFVMENVAIIDFRKVDKFWLVDLLTSRAAGKADE